MGLNWRQLRSASALSLSIILIASVLLPARVSALETYPVQPGDTLASIAELHGVSTASLAEANGLDVASEAPVGLELIIPGTDTSEFVTSGAVLIEGVPAYQQARSLSCEYASVYIATSTLGEPITEDHSLEALPFTDNPHEGYRGDIDGVWGNTDDYGIYAEPLATLLEEHGYRAEVTYSAEESSLKAQLDAGRPTIVWISTRGEPGFYDVDAEGDRYKLVPYMHVVVAYGYDSGGVYISDPGTGSYTYYSWSWFLNAWSVFDGMAVSVYPS